MRPARRARPQRTQPKYCHGARARRTIGWLNLCLVVVVGWLLLRGTVTGVTRYLGEPEPAWLAGFPYLFAASGLCFAFFLVRLILMWRPFFFRPEPEKTWYPEQPTTPR